MRVGFISHADCGRHDTGWEHPDHVGRLRAITRALRNVPELWEAVDQLEGRHATPDEIALAHDTEYIAMVEQLAASGGGRRGVDYSARAHTSGATPASAL